MPDIRFECEAMGLRDAIRDYFERHPRAKKALGVATAIATNFAIIASGSAALAVAASTIVKHQEDKDKQRRNEELVDFFKEAVQDPAIREALKNAVQEGGVEIANHVSVALNQLGTARPEAGQFVSSLKSEITVVIQQMGIIREMLSYYEVPDTQERVLNVWRLPAYLDDVLVIEEQLQSAIDAAIEYIRDGKNVVILGAPGSGKTTAMYVIWKQLGIDTDTALVWDTKDISRVHEKGGIILFTDDIPETRELARAIVEKDARGIVTTAREQEWSRLPIELRKKFSSIAIPEIPDSAMKEIALKHLESQDVKFEEDALQVLVESAQGSPIYVRYMAEEIGAEFRIGALDKLTAERVKKAPKGMTSYVAGILARILFNLEGTIYKPQEGALPVIKTLLCLADMPNYETHEVHLNQIFFKVKAPTDGPGPYNAIKQYLSRDPQFFSLKFMHDTLADVLRGKVDHPIVGDIRMLAQEMGVSGRLNVEKQALTDGWDHVKEEYEVDHAGGLEPLLAYAYFAAKNFGVENVEQLAIDLANEHIETPLSQGLFAITGPISEIPIAIDKASIPSVVDDIESPRDSGKSELPAAVGVEDAIGKLVKEKIGGALGEDFMKDLDIAGGLKGLGTTIRAAVEKAKEDPEIAKGLSDLQSMKMPKSVSKYIEGALSGIGADIEKPKSKRRTSFQRLEKLLKQDSVSPSKLSRALTKAALKATVVGKNRKLKDAQSIGELIKEGANRLVLLDSMEYIDILDDLREGLVVTVGDLETARIITEITGEIEVKLLDEKTQKEIGKVFDNGVKHSAKLSDFKSYRAYFSGKWSLLGIDTKDQSTVASQISKLMSYGRTDLAFELLSSFNELYDDSRYENRISLTIQAFKGLSKAKFSEQDEIQKAVDKVISHLDKHIEWMRTKEVLSHNETAAELCLTAVASTVSIMETYVKSSGQSDNIYPLLYEILKPVVANAVEALKMIGLEKTSKSMVKTIEKLKGENESKVEMLKLASSLLT